ncbi:MAG: AAA family ATPase, partial [Chloroflexi bacterium]|nr:AAA family ATPase [Chloroflexota bacterium]
RLTDGHGRTVDFRNTIIIMTSNLGTQELQRQQIGFSRGQQRSTLDDQRLRTAVESALRQAFRPEFLNRIDEVIVFHQLTEENIKRIVDLQMKAVVKRMEEYGLNLEWTDAARTWLAKEGYDPAYGARPLRRAIQRHVENELSRGILRNQFTAGQTIMVDADGGKLTFHVKELEPVSA